MTEWTHEQKQAITFRGDSLLVAAAAGSGKTAVLVERIIAMITGEDPIDIDELLVVTFTRAAAAEMRERIALAIARALEQDQDSQRLVKQLALLNQASITTIDAFCKKVVEDNFHLVDLDPDYQLLPATELSQLLEEAMNEVLEEAYELGEPDFLSLADTFGGERDDQALVDMVTKIWTFSRSGTDPRKWIREASAMYDLEGKALKDTPWYRYLLREVREVVEEADNAARRALHLIDSDEALAASKYKAFFEAEYAQLSKLNAALADTPPYAELQAQAGSLEFLRLPTVKAAVSPDQPRVKALRDYYKNLLTKLKKEWLSRDEATERRLIMEMAQPMAALGRLTLAFDERVGQKKRENQRVDFADLEHYALSILRDEHGPTEAARNYQEHFAEVLIDEYQDSNEVQEAILTAVSREQRNIFMVGDVKQSIYRFRQAKPEIFLAKYKRFRAPLDQAGCDGRKILLYRNFRSRPEILACVNRLFGQIMTERAGELDYTEDEALIYGASFPGGEKIPVEIHLIGSDTPLEEAGEEAEELEDVKGVELEARYLASRIREMVGKGETRVNDRGVLRPLHYRDIVILLRATARVAPVFKEALEQAAVPVFSDTGAGYFDSIEIRTMMSLLRIIDNPRQDVPLLAVLRSPLFSFTEDELIGIRSYERQSLYLDCLKEMAQATALTEGELFTREKVTGFLRQLDSWREESIHLPLDEFIWKLYSDTAYLEYAGAMPNGIQRQANLRILFQRAGEYERTAFKGLYQFIRYIDAMRERASSDYGDARIMSENEDVVRIMSIHKSKGLEFPVVFLANCGKRFNRMDQNGDMILHETLGIAVKHRDPQRGTVEDTLPRLVLKGKINEEGISEEMRVLYVAMTRAKERLFITGNLRGVSERMQKWHEEGLGMADTGLSPRMILNHGSTLDWIMPVVLNTGAIGDQLENLAEGVTRLSDGENFTISLISRSDLLEEKEALEEAAGEPFWQGEQLTDERLISILDYRYPHQIATELPSKVSVSVIKKRVITENAEAQDSRPMMDEAYELKETLPMPEFLKESRALGGAARGTAFHSVMLHINPFVQSLAQVDEEIQRLVKREILLPEEAAVVDGAKVLHFFGSDLGARFRQAAKEDRLYREEVFTRELPARELVPEWAVEDPVTLIGIIDAFFLEGEDIVLLDYKTDAVPRDAQDFLKNRYQAQIDLYAQALTAITGRKVREAYLYSVSREETIRLI